MNRRDLMVNLGAAASATLAARPLLAQGGPMMMGPGPGEMRYMDETKQVGAMSLVASREALHRAQNPKVLEFARFEVAEQETIADILMGMTMPPDQASGVITPPMEQQLMMSISPEGREALQRLRGMDGPGFEREYIMAQVGAHQRLLRIQQSYLDAGHMRNALNVAKLAKGMITEHLQLLNDIQNRMS